MDKTLLSDEGRRGVVRLAEAVSVYEKWRQLEKPVKRAQAELRQAFLAQGRQFVREFGRLRYYFREDAIRESYLPEDAWLSLWDEVGRATLALLLAPVVDVNRAGLLLGAKGLMGQLGMRFDFDLANPRAVAYLREHGAALVAGINETTEQEMRTLLTQAMEEGWSHQRTAKAINEQFEGFAGLKPQKHIRNRAELVAVTEAGMAYEHSSRIVVDDLQAAGIRIEKKWLTIGDNRVSKGCEKNELEGWIPLDQAFSSGHQQPLRFPGCRCTCQFQMAK